MCNSWRLVSESTWKWGIFACWQYLDRTDMLFSKDGPVAKLVSAVHLWWKYQLGWPSPVCWLQLRELIRREHLQNMKQIPLTSYLVSSLLFAEGMPYITHQQDPHVIRNCLRDQVFVVSVCLISHSLIHCIICIVAGKNIARIANTVQCHS